MMQELAHLLLIDPIFNLMAVLFKLTGNLGVSIVLFTVIVRLLLVPATLPSLKNMRRQQKLQPEIDKIKEKYKNNRQKQAEEQMKLFKEHGLNPLSGCLPQILMLIVLIAVYSVVGRFSTATDVNALNETIYFDFIKLDTAMINTRFLWFDLAKPDPYYILAIASGVLQFIVSKKQFSIAKKGGDLAKKTPDRTDDIAYNAQQQMIYMAPIFTVFIGLSLPAGAVLYITVTTLFQMLLTLYLYRDTQSDKLEV